jgi:hypothetical protein
MINKFLVLAALALLLYSSPALAGEQEHPGDTVITLYFCGSIDPLMRQKDAKDQKASIKIWSESLRSGQCNMSILPTQVKIVDKLAEFEMHDGPTEVWSIETIPGYPSIFIMLDAKAQEPTNAP